MHNICTPKTRIDKDRYYLGIAESVAQRSTCLRRRYGAIIVKNDETIATGFNGAPRGEPNCIDLGTCERERLNIPKGTRYELCLSGDTVVKLLNGTYKTLKQLADEHAENFWVYSVDTSTGKIVPAIATCSRITGHATTMLEITFDNGKTVRCTKDHRFLLRDCTYTAASELVPGDSIMPMYYNFAINDGYESICNTGNKRNGQPVTGGLCGTHSTLTHQLVFEYINGKLVADYRTELIHHKNTDRLDNTPENLELITRKQHSTEHLRLRPIPAPTPEQQAQSHKTFRNRLRTDPEFAKRISENGRKNMTRNWSDPEFRKAHSKRNISNGKKTVAYLNTNPDIIRTRNMTNVAKGLSLLLFKKTQAEDTTEITAETYPALREKYKTSGKGGVRIPKLATVLKYYQSIDDAISQAGTYNHKVMSVKEITYDDYVYDLEVPKTGNFAIDLGDNSCVFVHNCRSVHAEQNCVISAARRDMIGATIYIVGLEPDGTYANPEPCIMCRRFIVNAGITKCIGMYKDEGPKTINLKPSGLDIPEF